MHVENLTNVDFLGFILGIITFSWVIFRVVPGAGLAPPRTVYTEAEVRAYDPALPKYFLVATLALALGAAHAAVKSLPPVAAWLAQGGHGGHLVRDMSNTHLDIVLGGTIAATGLTWLVLPRVVGHPLASHKLATLSFWATTLGAFGFYLTNLVVGVVLARLYHQGVPYDPTAKNMLGLWRTIPISGTAGVMGVGYWTFVANVYLTVLKARKVQGPRPLRHLGKYFLVGATGLFIGTVQGVVQVMPDKEAWLHAAGPAGRYIDPIAHAHVNLVMGTMMLLAGLVFWWTQDPEGDPARRRTENVVFWLMTVGSGSFYLVFMRLGWVEGHLIIRQHLTFEQAVAREGLWHSVPIAVSGSLMLLGLWSVIFTIARRCLAGLLPRPTALMVLAGTATLFVGSLQGIAQTVPAVKTWLVDTGEYGEMLTNAHAQLNMLGGVILVLFALGLDRADLLFGRPAPDWVRATLLRRAGPGIVVYYVSSVVGLVVAGQSVLSGGRVAPPVAGGEVSEGTFVPVHNVVSSWLSPLGMSVGAALYAAGFWVVAGFAWWASREFRVNGWLRLRLWADAYEGSPPFWASRVPRRYYLFAEIVGASAGFPGFGWILSGRPLIGLPLALVNPGIVWGAIPVLVSGYYGIWQTVTVAYLGAVAVLSVGMLALLLSRPRPQRALVPAREVVAP